MFSFSFYFIPRIWYCGRKFFNFYWGFAIESFERFWFFHSIIDLYCCNTLEKVNNYSGEHRYSHRRFVTWIDYFWTLHMSVTLDALDTFGLYFLFKAQLTTTGSWLASYNFIYITGAVVSYQRLLWLISAEVMIKTQDLKLIFSACCSIFFLKTSDKMCCFASHVFWQPKNCSKMIQISQKANQLQLYLLKHRKMLAVRVQEWLLRVRVSSWFFFKSRICTV